MVVVCREGVKCETGATAEGLLDSHYNTRDYWGPVALGRVLSSSEAPGVSIVVNPF